MSSRALKILGQEGLVLTHYYSLTDPGYHFATPVAVTRWVRVKMVLVSDRALICKAASTEGKPSLTELCRLGVYTPPLPLHITDVCTWLRPWEPNTGRRAHYSYVFGEEQAGKEEKKCWEQQHPMFRPPTNPDRHPNKSFMLKWKYFYPNNIYPLIL